MRISIETSEFSPHAMKFIYNYTFKRPQEPAVLEAAGKALEVTCGVMEKQLAKTPFLAGGEFSIADIGFMPYIEYTWTTPAQRYLLGAPPSDGVVEQDQRAPELAEGVGEGVAAGVLAPALTSAP